MIEINHLDFRYKKKKPLFEDFSMTLGTGSIVGLLGKNGAGKSTLLHLLAGLIPLQKGTLTVNGWVPFDRKPAFLSNVCLVPEEFGFPSVSIQNYVSVTSAFYPNFDLEKLAGILREFELDPASKLNQLSHGQRKKFLIAFALSTNCSLLILDEPTNGLDIPSKSQFRKILVSSVTEEQLVIISTHQVKDIENVIDRIVVVDNGTLLYEECLTPINQQWYFETVPALSDAPDAVYTDSGLTGYRVVRPVKDGVESPLDLELFFNAIINHSIPHKL